MITRRTFTSLGTGAGLMGLVGLVGCRDVGGGASSAIEGPHIQSVCVSSGGGMTGGGESSELRRESDGTVVLSTRSREWHSSRETGVDYVLDESAFERLAEIANEYDLRAASTRKESEFMALDAPTSSLTFSLMDEDGMYDPDASFSISDSLQLTERDREGWRAVATALAELAAAAEGVPYLEPASLTLAASGTQYHFTLNESAAAQGLAERCPLQVTLQRDADGELFFALDEPLDVTDAPQSSAAAGSCCYDAAAGTVSFRSQDGEPTDSLFELGFIEDTYDIQFLADAELGEAYVWSNAWPE